MAGVLDFVADRFDVLTKTVHRATTGSEDREEGGCDDERDFIEISIHFRCQ